MKTVSVFQWGCLCTHIYTHACKAELMIMASHQIFTSQVMYLSSQTKFGHIKLLYIINAEVIEFTKGKWKCGQFSVLIKVIINPLPCDNYKLHFKELSIYKVRKCDNLFCMAVLHHNIWHVCTSWKSPLSLYIVGHHMTSHEMTAFQNTHTYALFVCTEAPGLFWCSGWS